MSKPLIFISGYCDYCKELMTNLMKNNIQSKFDYVNVDEGKEIPLFVDRVPLMYFDKKILFEDGLFEYIEKLKTTLLTKDDQIKPFMIGEMSNHSLSDPYSYLGESNDSKNEPTFEKNYGHIGMDDQKIYTPEEENVKERNQSTLEELISRRKNDIKY